MIIVAGARSAAEASWLFANGVGEVYCGVVGIPNHRRDSLSLGEGREFRDIIALAAAEGRKALLLLNESCPPRGEAAVAEKVRRFVELGAAGVVLKDLPMLDLLRAAGVKTDYILSSLAPDFNSASLELFVSRGIKRVILPYHLPPGAARGIIKNRWDIPAEMFYYPAHFCQNVDPLCTFCSRKPCKAGLRSGGRPFRMPSPGPDARADMMYDGFHAGVKYLKIPRTLDFGGLKRFVAGAVRLDGELRGGAGRVAFRRRYAEAYSSSRV